MRKADRYRSVIEYFEREMPSPRTELHFENPYQLIVAVILSAQCTDRRVNLITPPLFSRFPTVTDLAKARVEEIYGLIKSCSYPNNKARLLSGMAGKVVADFGGEIPDTIDELITLPGVGRKTANVILSVIYDRPAMAVDTHVFRVADRIGLTTAARTPLAAERQLTAGIPAGKLGRAHHWLILHGRYVCKARRPLCDECGLTDVCRHYLRNKPIDPNDGNER